MVASTAISYPIASILNPSVSKNSDAVSRKLTYLQNADISEKVNYDNSVWTAIPGNFSTIANDIDIVLSKKHPNIGWFRDFRGKIGAHWFGVRADGITDDTLALQSSIQAAFAIRASVLELPAGEMLLTANITVSAAPGKDNRFDQFTIQGVGAGRNGSFLHFRSGTLVIKTPNHVISDLYVTSDDSDGISIAPTISPTKSFPVRSIMQNVRAEDCKGSGITITNSWIYTMINVFARRNKKWGLEGKSGAIYKLSCNALNIIGGEFQGNGSRASKSSKSGKGQGGGLFTGRSVQFSMTNSAIEGNVGDGLVVEEEVRGLTLLGCYFEKNGSHFDNVDIGNAKPSKYALGPNSGFILNCNFTPQNVSGVSQKRAIDLMDFLDLKIVNPQFYEQKKSALYTEPPIRIRESVEGRATGWIEGGALLSSRYTQDMVENLCGCFGRPSISRFSPNITLPAQKSTETQRFLIILPQSMGRRIASKFVVRSKKGAGQIRLRTIYRRGPHGTRVSNKDHTILLDSSVAVGSLSNRTSQENWHGHVEVSLERLGTNASDNLNEEIKAISLEITTYEGHITV